MTFNSYIIKMDFPESDWRGNAEIGEKAVFATFQRISEGIFQVHFARGQDLKFREQGRTKTHNISFTILLPFISKYNKRKLKKISDQLNSTEIDNDGVLDILLTVENYLDAEVLLPFLSIERETMLQKLVAMELEKKVKIIGLHRISVTPYSHYNNLLQKLLQEIDHQYQNLSKTVKLSQLEALLKIPKTSLLFSFLLRIAAREFPFKVIKNMVTFHNLPLSKKEQDTVTLIEKSLSKNRQTIFSLDNVIKITNLPYSEVNGALWILFEKEELTQLNETYFIFSKDLNKIVNRLKKYKRNQGDIIDIQSIREMTQFNRKQIILLLEFFDEKEITERVEDKRRILLDA